MNLWQEVQDYLVVMHPAHSAQTIHLNMSLAVWQGNNWVLFKHYLMDTTCVFSLAPDTESILNIVKCRVSNTTIWLFTR